MTEEKPKELGQWLAETLQAGLPQLLAGPAGNALSRLVGGVVDIPAAWLEQRAQSIRDETNAKSAVMEALSAKSAELGMADQALLGRGLDNLLGQAFREQTNREEVARGTVEQLRIEPPPLDGPGPSDDWMNLFESHAARASSRGVREMFSRILAGEIRRPGAFSLQTLHMVSVLDATSAAVISKIAPLVIEGCAIIRELARAKLDYEELLLLEEADFLKIGADMVDFSLPIQEDSTVIFGGKEKALVAKFALQSSGIYTMRGYPLTRAGRELYKAIPVETDFQTIADALWNSGAKSVRIGRVTTDANQVQMIADLVEIPMSAGETETPPNH